MRLWLSLHSLSRIIILCHFAFLFAAFFCNHSICLSAFREVLIGPIFTTYFSFSRCVCFAQCLSIKWMAPMKRCTVADWQTVTWATAEPLLLLLDQALLCLALYNSQVWQRAHASVSFGAILSWKRKQSVTRLDFSLFAFHRRLAPTPGEVHFSQCQLSPITTVFWQCRQCALWWLNRHNHRPSARRPVTAAAHSLAVALSGRLSFVLHHHHHYYFYFWLILALCQQTQPFRLTTRITGQRRSRQWLVASFVRISGQMVASISLLLTRLLLL